MDENDRALLENAAKAAGYTPDGAFGRGLLVLVPDADPAAIPFDPLNDDGDALRLAVKLRFGMIPLEGGGWDVVRYSEDGSEHTLSTCTNSGDWALRECITRAAAAIGKELKHG